MESKTSEHKLFEMKVKYLLNQIAQSAWIGGNEGVNPSGQCKNILQKAEQFLDYMKGGK